MYKIKSIMWVVTHSECVWQSDSPRSRLRSQHCVFARWSSPRGWHPFAASSSPTCPSVLHQWTHPARAPLNDKGKLIRLTTPNSVLSLQFGWPMYTWNCLAFHFYSSLTLALNMATHSHRPFKRTENLWNTLNSQKTITNSHRLHFHQPAQISGQPLGLG